MTIFVSIAAYRDPQLVPTVLDCLAKARHPEALRFGICWQHGPEETSLPFADDPRFQVLDVDWRESKGACWARAALMDLVRDEDYFLQLDSHHRFTPDWDVKVLAELERTGSPKPVLTAYATPFTPGDPDTFGGDAPMQMNYDRFTPEGIVLFRPSVIPDHRTRTKPLRARFLSGHFLFAPRAFVAEVPYDPELYFIGEEITLSIRAYTHGWDFFHPNQIIVYHEYTRAYREHKHWSDHREGNDVAVAWHVRDASSKSRAQKLIDERTIGPFACGTARSFEDYEAYAGLSFKQKKAQDYTRQHLEPPNPPAPPDWADRIARYDLRIPIDRAVLPEGAETARFWYVGFHDVNERELFRFDADAGEIRKLLTGDAKSVVIARSFESTHEPASWTVWPFGADGGWLDKIRGEIAIARPRPATFVTALLDLGRSALGAPFGRSFETHYLPRFERLLSLDAPMVVYVPPELEPLVWKRRRREDTRVVHISQKHLERLPFSAQVETIRKQDAWRAQSPSLASSPQAQLEGYASLVLSKPLLLRDVARDNPFRTDAFFFVDAALSHTVPEALLLDRARPTQMTALARDLVFVAFPHRADREIHGFTRDAMERIAGVPSITRVVRGGFFGGRRDALLGLTALYESLLRETLASGLLGTEESLLTLLDHRHPELLRAFEISADGLLGPFFDAVHRGDAEKLRRPPREARALPPGLVAEDRATAARGEVRFFGLRMQQNRNAPAALDGVFARLEAEGTRIARIVEIGTGTGGLTVLLALYAASVGAELVTYDIASRTQDNPAFARLGIDHRIADVREPFVAAEIARMIAAPGVTLFVCDGGDKLRDADVFADHMKPGDLLLVHDYATDEATFERDVKGRLWSWCEATDAGLRAASERNDLREVHADLLHPAVWTCRRKHGAATKDAPRANLSGRSVALYALSYNLPAQFAALCESIERADPEMLARTDKHLFNNSTDPTTFAAYDALCARYGFTQTRNGNLGITGGRIACAHHFEDGPHDAMLYFEDDMLLSTKEGVCRNGFPTHVPRLFERALAILANEPGLDFLKLSFSELFGDHRVNWAATNLDDAGRARYFPTGPETRVTAVKSHDGLGYMLAEVHYANWPMLITRRGSRTLFDREAELPRHEQGFMVRALELGRAGALRSGVLLASPIDHHRAFHYAVGTRKES